MYALVKFKRGGTIKVKKVKDIKVVIKKDGCKTFADFEPVDEGDFSRTREKKYVVFDKKDDIIQRWYVIIGCLGGSRKEVWRKASDVYWVKGQDMAKVKMPTVSPLNSDNDQIITEKAQLLSNVEAPRECPVNSDNNQFTMETPQDVLKRDVEKAISDKTSEIFVKLGAIEEAMSLQEKEIKSLTDSKQIIMETPQDALKRDVEKAINDKTSEIFVKLGAIEEAMSMQEKEIKSLAEKLQTTIARVDECQKLIPNLSDIFVNSVQGIIINEMTSMRETFSNLHKGLLESVHNIKGMNHVHKWLEKVPSEFKVNNNEGRQTVTPTDVPMEKKKNVPSSDDSIENISEGSWEQSFWMKEALGSTDTVSDEGIQNGNSNPQKIQTNL